MARPRNICQDAVLDAAEAVVLRAGAARLTLDAVAAQAGISKPTVVYDFRSKHALFMAIFDRGVGREAALLRAAAEAAGEASDASVRAQVAVAAERLPDDVQAVSLQLCSALTQHGDLRESFQLLLHEQVSEIIGNSKQPRLALIAFLAVKGLLALETLGLLAWSEEGRRAVLRDIERLLDQPPDAPSASAAERVPAPLQPPVRTQGERAADYGNQPAALPRVQAGNQRNSNGADHR